VNRIEFKFTNHSTTNHKYEQRNSSLCNCGLLAISDHYFDSNTTIRNTTMHNINEMPIPPANLPMTEIVVNVCLEKPPWLDLSALDPLSDWVDLSPSESGDYYQSEEIPDDEYIATLEEDLRKRNAKIKGKPVFSAVRAVARLFSSVVDDSPVNN
jgi:hypothetical protein